MIECQLDFTCKYHCLIFSLIVNCVVTMTASDWRNNLSVIRVIIDKYLRLVCFPNWFVVVNTLCNSPL